ncbi:acetyl-CoA carboxylase carboxyl transferase subunit beta [Candidatus Poribacteria bacterium]|nr:acetyl-CoA carboxylase carboxyl transferase subunit beta [Candidatus Poribacteria bacterium]
MARNTVNIEGSFNCPECGKSIDDEELLKNYKVCPFCNYHNPVGAQERISMLLDPGTFIEYDPVLNTSDPLNFPLYKERIKKDQKSTGLVDAVITGKGELNGIPLVIGITDYRFRMGSMGSVLGEKITRCMEKAIEENLPVIIFSSSGGGARMQEGMLSLMQMAKTSASSKKLRKARILYINVLSFKSFAGVMASFAGLGHIIIAEPGTQIGFTGERGRSSISQELPEGFQTAKFMVERGMIDMIVERNEMKSVLADLLDFFS